MFWWGILRIRHPEFEERGNKDNKVREYRSRGIYWDNKPWDSGIELIIKVNGDREHRQYSKIIRFLLWQKVNNNGNGILFIREFRWDNEEIIR